METDEHLPQLPRTPSFRLEGKRALVTGAGRGIGLAAAAALAQAGAQVTLAARTDREIEAAAAAIAADGGVAEALRLDVEDHAAVEEILAARPPYDILINNAGTNRPAAFENVSVADFDAIMGLNVKSAFFVAQAVVRGLIAARKPGSIIHISSQMGRVGGVQRSVYCASKHAIEGLTKAMAIDLAPHGIRVNSICPTFVETSMTKAYFEEPEFRTDVLKKIKLGRVCQLEDLMGSIVLLACEGSAMMTGSSVVIDGGWTAE